MADTLVLDPKTAADKQTAWWLYLAHAVTFLGSFGLLSIIPLVINYIQSGQAEDSFVRSHHRWMIRSFWWYVVWCGACILLAITLVGIPLAAVGFIAAWIWKAYRLLRGFLDLNANRPMP